MTTSPEHGDLEFFYFKEDLFRAVNAIEASQKFILCDKNTAKFCYTSELNGKLIIIPSGDSHKSPETFIKISNILSEEQADKDALLINLGGGMISDLGGFAASVFKRGIRFVNIPTTTLGMADAAYGGKNGLNLPLAKNVIGTIYFPQKVYITSDFLKTLPQREYKAGFAEVLKMMLLFRANEWNDFAQNPILPDSKNALPFLQLAVNLKKEVVQKDPFEKDLRKSLNYGHTVGHAIESAYLEGGINLLHGEAIFWGMMIENKIAVRMGLMQNDQANLIHTLLNLIHPLPTKFEFKQNILASILNDKKNLDGEVRMVLVNKPGSFKIDVSVPLNCIENAIH